MRPVYLEMNAFGPYAGKQIIDFRDLKDRNLFLICGPTGAGKTTILDAICYALYGDTSGRERSGANMRSKFAGADEMTYVKFEFTIGEKQYRVERYPQQERLKKRGEGTLWDPGSAVLCELDSTGAEKRVIAAKNVEKAVNDLLGFQSEQFRQVVLLPQGDFRKLLLANSTDRQNIMQVLFRTQRYSRFQELLRERHDAIEQANGTINGEVARILQNLSVENEEMLEKRRLELEVRQKQTEKDKRKAVADRDAYQKTVGEAKVLASHWEALKKSRAAMAVLQKQAPAMADTEIHIEQLKRAQLLAEPCKNLDDIQSRGTTISKELSRAGDKAKIAAKALKTASAGQAAIDAGEEKHKADTEQLVQLQGLVEKVQHYAAAEKQWRKSKTKSDRLDKELKTVLADKDTMKKKIESGTVLQKQLQQLLVQQEKTKSDVISLQDRVQQEKTIAGMAAQWHAGTTALAEAKELLKRLTRQAHQDKVDHDAVQAAFLQGQAALLARTLKEGEACPVCGATAHPQLAAIPADLPEKEDVARRKDIADASEAERQQQHVAVETAAATVKEQKRQWTGLRKQYPEEGTLADWQKRWEEAKKQSEAQTQEIEQLRADTKEIQGLAKNWEKIEKQEIDMRAGTDSAHAALAAASAVKEQAAADVPAQYRTEAVLQEAIRTLAATIQQFEQKRKEVQLALQKATTENATCEESVRNLQAQVEVFRTQYKEATDALKDRVLAAGFASVSEYRAMQKDVPSLPKEEKAVADYKEKVQQIEGRIKQEEQAVGTSAEPDMEQYQKTLDEKNACCDRLIKEAAELKNEHAAVTAGGKQISDFHTKQGSLMEQYKTIGTLYDMVSGKTSGGINFERYVLGALLDDVLAAANERLKEMSRQRYQLQRSQKWEDRRKTFGLDIDVFDTYTGYARPANTLSGGETFLASLSLALGLADVVQSYAGGIRMDTIFIDEGFGTLDTDTLDFALQALLELEKGGRLVGIISHVPELQERIDTQLVITKTDRGSTAAFELA